MEFNTKLNMYKIVEKYAFLPPNPPSYSKNSVNYIDRKDLPSIPFLFYETETDSAEYTILYTHGNAEDLGQMVPLVMTFVKRIPANVLIYDYTGYGYNGTIGNCSESATYRDIRDVWTYLTETKGLSPDKIVLYGRSLGTGPTVQLAAELSDKKIYVGGVVLQSPLMSAVSVVSNALSYLPFTDIFVNYKKVNRIVSPVFILHGVHDNVVPYKHGNYLSMCCNRITFWSINGAGHNDIEAYHIDELILRLQNFLGSLKTEGPVRLQNQSVWTSCSFQ